MQRKLEARRRTLRRREVRRTAAEKKAHDFYDQALPGITNPEVRELFAELRDEETEHVEMLREAMARLPESASVETENDPDDAPYL